MRSDAVGFFWADLPPPKKEKLEKPKRFAPEPVWLKPDYLPGLEEARRFPIEEMHNDEILAAIVSKDKFLYDTEVYENYFCAIFRSYATGKCVVFERHMDGHIDNPNWCDDKKFRWLIKNATIVTFNGINFDLPITALYLDGCETDQLKEAADNIILRGWRAADVLKFHRVAALPVDHIDLIEVAPLFASLKTYGGRLHVPRMQDLPFHPSTVLTKDQIAITRWYCVNDTTSTGFLLKCLEQQIDLRYNLSNEQGIDLRSKSDAQIAEMIIGAEYQRRTGKRARRPEIAPGTTYFYECPYNLRFQTPLMQEVLRTVCRSPFIVGDDGYILLPESVAKLEFVIGETTYQMGDGGLHSKEKSIAHHSDDYWQLIDKDVASYYPMLILKNGYYPEHLGPIFLEIFGGITKRRLQAKADKLKAIADSLKIVINGTYGKLGSKWSIVYAPKLRFHVTLGGQLYLLMLIEALELSGIRVVSANTDGVMVKCPKHLLGLLDQVMKWWEDITGFETEGKNYKALYSRDINNYIAIDEKNEVKHKGAYANPWNDPKENPEKKLHKNPVTTVCIEAVDAFLTNGTPLEETLWHCKDIRKFIRIVSVDGGAVKDGQYLGKSIRWYYSINERGKEMVRAKNGHMVSKSTGGLPCMQLPEEFPQDIDYDWYLAESKKILKAIGATVY